MGDREEAKRIRNQAITKVSQEKRYIIQKEEKRESDEKKYMRVNKKECNKKRYRKQKLKEYKKKYYISQKEKKKSVQKRLSVKT